MKEGSRLPVHIFSFTMGWSLLKTFYSVILSWGGAGQAPPQTPLHCKAEYMKSK